jgi:hypothetical protein
MLLAVLAAATYGTGVALQHRAASQQPAELSMRLGLLARLIRDPWWLLGLLCDVVGFFLEVAALAYGPLVIVQPLLMTAVVFALLVNSALTKHSPTHQEWLAVASAGTGLAIFLAFVAPTEAGADEASTRAWVTAAVILGSLIAVTAIAGLRSTGVRKAAFLGFAAGVANAVMSVLARAFGIAIEDGWLSVIDSWEPYALIFGGALALLLQQSAYQAGRPTTTLPLITIVDPIVASITGILLFGEYLRVGGLRTVAALVAIAAILGGLAYLCRSPAVAGEPEPSTEREPV